MNQETFFDLIGKRNIFFFKTKTTGENLNEKSPLSSPPTIFTDEIIQLAYILYNPITSTIIEKNEYYIQPRKQLTNIDYCRLRISPQEFTQKSILPYDLYSLLESTFNENPIFISYHGTLDFFALFHFLQSQNIDRYHYMNLDIFDLQAVFANYYPFSKKLEYSVNQSGIIIQKNYGHRLINAIETLCNRKMRTIQTLLDKVEEILVVYEAMKNSPNINLYDFINVVGYYPTTKEMRGYIGIIGHHFIYYPYGYNGSDYLHELMYGEIPEEYGKYQIPYWIYEQEFEPRLWKEWWRVHYYWKI